MDVLLAEFDVVKPEVDAKRNGFDSTSVDLIEGTFMELDCVNTSVYNVSVVVYREF